MKIIQLLKVFNMVMHLRQPGCQIRMVFDNLGLIAGRALFAPDAAVSQTSVFSHIHSTKSAHFSRWQLGTSEAWQTRPHSWTQTINAWFFILHLWTCIHAITNTPAPTVLLTTPSSVSSTSVWRKQNSESLWNTHSCQVFSLPRLCNIDYVKIYLDEHMLPIPWNHRHYTTFYWLMCEISSSLWPQTSWSLLIIITKFHWSQAGFVWSWKRSRQTVKVWPDHKLPWSCWEVTENK